MQITICKTPEEASRLAGEIVNNAVKKNPKLVLGLATGSTPLMLYKEMYTACKAGLSYKKVRSFNLDEYYGLPVEKPQSYRSFMNENLFNHLDIDMKNTHVPDGLAKDVEKSCAQYEKMMKAAGGVDIQVLGIGGDGHIGFNEPGTSLVSRTHLVTLTPRTIKDNTRFFTKSSEVPRYAISMGVGTVMEAKCCLMLCFGKNKADAVKGMIEGGVSQFCPASALQYHPNTLVFLDEAAASKLTLKAYYKWACQHPAKLD
jgi:glucosamine-6-phosphate deaminase